VGTATESIWVSLFWPLIDRCYVAVPPLFFAIGIRRKTARSQILTRSDPVKIGENSETCAPRSLRIAIAAICRWLPPNCSP